MSNTIENLKNLNYEVVDNQGVSVTKHFTQCLEKEFADLEAKLTESEEAIKYLKGIKRYDIGEMLTENTKLKQQLAEKDEQIEYLKGTTVSIENFENVISELDQDKISFAVEQLKKVKDYALELFKKFCQSTEYNSNKSLVGRRFIEYYPFNDFINNQIKQLKEGK